jgi:hypothetical protein
MRNNAIFDWVGISALLGIMGWYGFVQIRDWRRRQASRAWPMVNATLQKGALGRISFGRGATAPAAFMGYAYTIGGVRYAGFFALYGEETAIQALHVSLPGSLIQIRYNPANPDVSFLADYKDSRFGSSEATQNSEWLAQAPPFDLQEAIR